MSEKTKQKHHNANWKRQSGTERRAELRHNASYLSASSNKVKPRKDRIPIVTKFGTRVPKYSLRRLLQLEKQLNRTARYFFRAFADWRAETPDQLANNQWPDRAKFGTVIECYKVVGQEITKRGVGFTPLNLVIPNVEAMPATVETEGDKAAVAAMPESKLAGWVTRMANRLMGLKSGSKSRFAKTKISGYFEAATV